MNVRNTEVLPTKLPLTNSQSQETQSFISLPSLCSQFFATLTLSNRGHLKSSRWAKSTEAWPMLACLKSSIGTLGRRAWVGSRGTPRRIGFIKSLCKRVCARQKGPQAERGKVAQGFAGLFGQEQALEGAIALLQAANHSFSGAKDTIGASKASKQDSRRRPPKGPPRQKPPRCHWKMSWCCSCLSLAGYLSSLWCLRAVGSEMHRSLHAGDFVNKSNSYYSTFLLHCLTALLSILHTYCFVQSKSLKTMLHAIARHE